jgi:peptidoglycan/xylan/chitin deacetylase (PgdA/CDA1 family)
MLHRAGALKAMMFVRRYAPVPISVSILTYHAIAEQDPNLPYDPGVPDASPAQFRRQMEMLARWGTPIGIDELIRAIDGAPLPKNPVMVTFDDGYKSCHDVALPILRAVGMRATFFIATSFIEERRLYWWERIAVALFRSRVDHATITYPRRIEVTPRAAGQQKLLSDLVKETPSLDIGRFLDELYRALGVEWNAEIEATHANEMIMTWDEVRNLARAGMDVESHSRHHRVLQTLERDALREELTGSRRDLEAQLGRPVRAIAYPVGRRITHFQKIREAVIEAGYSVGFSNSSGTTRIWPGPLREMAPIDRFDVRRLATDRAMSEAMYLTQIAVPRLAYIPRRNRD